MASHFNLTCDAFLGGRVLVRQPETGFRSGLDAVFLAAACSAADGDRVLEAGCGAGAAALCLLARVPGAHVTGVEIDPGLAALARANAEDNGVSSRFEIVAANVGSPWTELESRGLEPGGLRSRHREPAFFLASPFPALRASPASIAPAPCPRAGSTPGSASWPPRRSLREPAP